VRPRHLGRRVRPTAPPACRCLRVGRPPHHHAPARHGHARLGGSGRGRAEPHLAGGSPERPLVPPPLSVGARTGRGALPRPAFPSRVTPPFRRSVTLIPPSGCGSRPRSRPPAGSRPWPAGCWRPSPERNEDEVVLTGPGGPGSEGRRS